MAVWMFGLIITLVLLLPIQSYPPSKYVILKTFAENWLATSKEVSLDEPHFYFPLHPTNFYPLEGQEIWIGLSPPPILPCDVNRDGWVNWIDYAALVWLMDELKWFENIRTFAEKIR